MTLQITTSPSARTDAFTFYATASASFLESRVDTYVENLEGFFNCDEAILSWLRNVWLPEETEHGRLLKRYVTRTWPEFDWDHGFTLFSARYIPQCEHIKLRPSPGLEALARCVTETGATMIYRCIGAYTTDPKLKRLMRRISTDEIRHFKQFRDIHQFQDQSEGNGFLRKARTILARSELVRNEDLALSFEPLNHSWTGSPPFTTWSYAEFLAGAARVMKAHFPFDQAARMLVRPLNTRSYASRHAASILAALVTRRFLHAGRRFRGNESNTSRPAHWFRNVRGWRCFPAQGSGLIS